MGVSISTSSSPSSTSEELSRIGEEAGSVSSLPMSEEAASWLPVGPGAGGWAAGKNSPSVCLVLLAAAARAAAAEAEELEEGGLGFVAGRWGP